MKELFFYNSKITSKGNTCIITTDKVVSAATITIAGKEYKNANAYKGITFYVTTVQGKQILEVKVGESLGSFPTYVDGEFNCF